MDSRFHCAKVVGVLWAGALAVCAALPAGAKPAAQPKGLAAEKPAVFKPKAAFKVQLVNPAGVPTLVKEPVSVELDTAFSDRDQSLRELLGNKGLVMDQKTIAAVRKLNPAVRPDGTVPAGTQVTYFWPSLAPGQAGADGKTAFDMGLAAKYAVRAETTTARSVKQQTVALPASVYERPADARMHRELVADIETTATLVESRADKLSAKDLALSRYYLSQANAQARQLSGLSAAKSLPSDGVYQLQASVQPVQGMQRMMNAGSSPFEYRPVNVSVVAGGGLPVAEPLRVYALPGGVLDRPQSFSEAEVKSYLIALSFERLTSPSRSMVAQGDMRVWVGPDHAYDAMAKRIVQGGPIRFNAVLPSMAGGPERQIQFTSPDDVVLP